MINIGMLNKLISIVKIVPVEDTDGWEDTSSTEEKVLYSKIHASIIPSRGSEVLENGKITEKIPYKIIIRYRPDINSHCTVKYKNRTFDIKAVVNPYEDNEVLELYCEEKLRGDSDESDI